MHTQAQAQAPSIPSPAPEKEQSPKRSRIDSGSGQKEPGSGSGGTLPSIPGVQYEKHGKGGYEVWFRPAGKTHRRDKKYLAYIGKKRLASSAGELESFIRGKMTEKGTTG